MSRTLPLSAGFCVIARVRRSGLGTTEANAIRARSDRELGGFGLLALAIVRSCFEPPSIPSTRTVLSLWRCRRAPFRGWLNETTRRLLVFDSVSIAWYS